MSRWCLTCKKKRVAQAIGACCSHGHKFLPTDGRLGKKLGKKLTTTAEPVIDIKAMTERAKAFRVKAGEIEAFVAEITAKYAELTK